MTDMTPAIPGELDDFIAGFQVEGRAVRGRVLRSAGVLNRILSAHDYPEPVARLLGEAVILAGLVGPALKFDGRLIVQANGTGPVSFIVAEYVAGEGVRGFAKVDREALDTALAAADAETPTIRTLLGEGYFAMTIDQGPDMDQYQGVVPLEGASLAVIAEHYFAQSEQTPTRLRMAVGEVWTQNGGKSWRGGGSLIQAVAGDESRGSATEDWDHVRALFETISDEELLDPDLSAGALLFRLFHEDGVRVFEPAALLRRCSCEHQRLLRIIASFPADDREHMTTDGKIVMTCEYCNRDWKFLPEEVASAAG
ncbi:Hsp33 family molecular chaperone [Maricaulis sp.]|uniref:Hsp33 family molecular chaperone n=1 Tax=Maricaulis sp. TaxID=1486257 RepID=UPI003A959B9E